MMKLVGIVLMCFLPTRQDVEMPDSVTPGEYAVYSAWIDSRFAQPPVKSIGVESQTIAINPLTIPCKNPSPSRHGNHDAPRFEAIANLGAKTFHLDSNEILRTRGANITTEKTKDDHVLHFSRVALTDSASKALFVVIDQHENRSDTFIVSAEQIDKRWVFETLC